MFYKNDFYDYTDAFESRKVYEDYCQCVNKIRPGDLLHLYLNGTRTRFASVVTDRTVVFPVIGITRNALHGERILIGSNSNRLRFWSHAECDPGILTHVVQDFNEYKYMWWLRSVRDGRIAKIELNKNMKFRDFF